MKFVEWKALVLSKADGKTIHKLLGILGVVYSSVFESSKSSRENLNKAIVEINKLLHTTFSTAEIDEANK